jgi:rare lipoprotein A
MKISQLLLLAIILTQLSACGVNKKLPHQNDVENYTSDTRYQKNEEGSPVDVTKNHYKQVGMASYYGGKDGLHNKKTASGQKFDKNALTAAHPTLPLLSMVRVTNLENNKIVVLTVNDRGPFTKNRIIDISEHAAKILHMKQKGSAKVMVEYLGDSSKKITIKPKTKKNNAK